MKLTQGLMMEATSKQFAKSKHVLKLLSLCLEYFIWGHLLLNWTAGASLYQEKIQHKHQRPQCFPNHAVFFSIWQESGLFGVQIPQFFLYFAESLNADRNG